MIKNVNGWDACTSFYIRGHLLFGDLYPGTIVRCRILIENINHTIKFYIPDIDLIFKIFRMRTLQERIEIPDKRACESKVLAEAQETQERTQDNHPT